MVKSFTAVTREIDDADAAVAEITEQIGIDKNLLKNSIGIISCFSEFSDTGVLGAVCDALPFDCIGASTSISYSKGESDQVIFAITVLTSDDCSFETVSIPLSENYEESIDSMLSAKLAERSKKPVLMLSYFPLMNTVSGDMILNAVDKVTGGTPLFGTCTVDHTSDYSTSVTIFNQETYRESAVFGLIYGDLDYSFEIAALNEKKIRNQKGVVTESNGNILISINNTPALEYFKDIGITEAVLKTGSGILPLVIDFKDGTAPVARAVIAQTPEGHFVCGGSMPEGSTLAIGRVDFDDVLNTTEAKLQPFVETDGFILGYSCIARYLALGFDITAEAEKVSEIAGDRNYMYACSGGEICPLPDADGKLKNTYHNYTIALCKLR